MEAVREKRFALKKAKTKHDFRGKKSLQTLCSNTCKRLPKNVGTKNENKMLVCASGTAEELLMNEKLFRERERERNEKSSLGSFFSFTEMNFSL